MYTSIHSKAIKSSFPTLHSVSTPPQLLPQLDEDGQYQIASNTQISSVDFDT
jgi:hypothetical protein